MSLFQCVKCGCIENTALSRYWVNGYKHICSECDPEIGKWHNRFTKDDAEGMLIDSDGMLHNEDPDHIDIIGEVPKK